jgi:biopolymer transport protein ExbD
VASVDTSNGKGGRQSLNVDLNLVPFIDLLSCLVLFLLVTAVWRQISVIPIGIESRKPASASTQIAPVASLSLKITPEGIKITQLGNEVVIERGSLEKLAAWMKENHISEHFPQASLFAEDSIPYGEVIRTLDTIKENGIMNVALGT